MYVIARVFIYLSVTAQNYTPSIIPSTFLLFYFFTYYFLLVLISVLLMFFFLQLRNNFRSFDIHRSTSKTQLTTRNSYSNTYCLCLLCGGRWNIKTSPQQQIISWWTHITVYCWTCALNSGKKIVSDNYSAYILKHV